MKLIAIITLKSYEELSSYHTESIKFLNLQIISLGELQLAISFSNDKKFYHRIFLYQSFFIFLKKENYKHYFLKYMYKKYKIYV